MDANEQVTQVIAGELPPEGRRGLVVTLLEVSEALLDLGQVGEVVGRHDLALHHRLSMSYRRADASGDMKGESSARISALHL